MNTVMVYGRLTSDCTTEKTKTGKSVCKFTVASPKEFSKEDANFINVEAWNGVADYLDKYGKKGGVVIVKGSLDVSKYQDNSGKNVTVTKVVANQVALVTTKPKEEQRQEAKLPSVDDIPGLNITSDDLPF